MGAFPSWASEWHPEYDSLGRFTEVFELASLVQRQNACALPGCTIKYDEFVPRMWRAVSLGFVDQNVATYVGNGLRWGFDLGAQRDLLRMGSRVFKNYDSALSSDAVGQVATAVSKRVTEQKTIDVGVVDSSLLSLMKQVFGEFFIFPVGAVPKPLEPGVMRPVDDLTRVGFNAATVMGILKHSLNTYKEISHLLKRGYGMHVTDVDNAFPLLALAPWVWPFMGFRFPTDASGSVLSCDHLFMHLFSGFGSKGAPGTFKLLFVDCFVNMARAEGVLTLPMPVYVDDSGIIGACMQAADREALELQTYGKTVGLFFKALKDKLAAPVQRMLGLFWDSFQRTVSLPDEKLVEYIELFLSLAVRRTLTLGERQSSAGKGQRAVMTLPPGASCLLTETYALMSGLSVQWQRKRTSAEERSNYGFMAHFLSLNMGQGYYSHEDLEPGPDVYTDASKSKDYTGGGWWTTDFFADMFVYGSKAARKPIDFLEGDTVVAMVLLCGWAWRGKIVRVFVDNQAFERSGEKGRSRAKRLNDLLKRLFLLQLEGGFVLRFVWISTHDNYLADHLSRGRWHEFLADAAVAGILSAGMAFSLVAQLGRKRTLDTTPPLPSVDLESVRLRLAERTPIMLYASWVSAALSIQRFARGALARRRLAAARDAAVERVGAFPRPMRRVPGPVPGTTRILFLLMCGLGLAAGGGRGGATAQDASLGFYTTDLFNGLPAELATRADEVLDNRLSPSSMRTVMAGFKYWSVVAVKHGWDYIIQTGDLERGAKLVALTSHMLDDTTLVGASIENYVWGVCTWMKLQHQADPRRGVVGWDDWMKAALVLSAVVREPRRAMPTWLIRLILTWCWARRKEFRWCQFGLFVLVLYFTFSRSECPCPKAKSGREAFDAAKHWMVRDLVIKLVDGMWALAVRFKGIKQDPRIQRPTARGDGTERGAAAHGGADWSYVGDVPDSLWSVFAWYRALMEFYPSGRQPEDPFFYDMSRRAPYTYSNGLTDMHHVLEQVNPDDTDYGLHPLRVSGYNDSKGANGLEVTVAHGRWESDAHTVYDRFGMRQVLSMAARSVGGKDVYSEVATAREVSRAGTQRVVLEAAQSAGLEPVVLPSDDSESESEEPTAPVEVSLLPPGWSEVVRTTERGRTYKVYIPPAEIGGPSRPSRAAAWRAVDEARRAAASVGTVSSTRGSAVSSPEGSIAAVPEGLTARERRNLFPPGHEDNWGLARPDLSLPRFRDRK